MYSGQTNSSAGGTINPAALNSPGKPSIRFIPASAFPILFDIHASPILAGRNLKMVDAPSTSRHVVPPMRVPFLATCDEPRNYHRRLASRHACFFPSPRMLTTSNLTPLTYFSSLLTLLVRIKRQLLTTFRHAGQSEPDPKNPSPLSTLAMTVRRCSSE